MQLLDGKTVAKQVKDSLKDFIQEKNIVPKLAVVQVGNNQASSTYVKNKEKACEYVGIDSKTYHLNEDIEEDVLLEFIDSLNYDHDINGILVQLPLPRHINEKKILEKIIPEKDVDGFHYVNVGKFNIGDDDAFMSCTPLGICHILKYYNIDVAGKECVVVGRSNIVGKPMANALLQMDGTVTVCHSKTTNLKEVCKRADVLVCATNVPKLFNKDYIKDGAVVIDVGIHRMENGKLCGNVDFDDVKDMNILITPVPGGVGVMTVAMLMNNCVKAACNQMEINMDNIY